MREIKLMVSSDTVQANQYRAGVKGSANSTVLVVQFDESWDGYSKKIVFWDALEQHPVERSLLVEETPRTYRTTIPGEPLAVAGECVLVIEGWTEDVRMRAMQVRLAVDDAPDADGAATPVDPTMTQMEQIQVFVENRLQEIRQVGQQVKQVAQDVSDSAEEMLTLARSFDSAVVQVKADIKQTVEQCKAELDSYSAHAPTIGTNDNWWLWDGEKYVDSGTPATGGVSSVTYNPDTWRWEVRYLDGHVDSFPGHSPIEGDKFTIHRDNFESYPVGEDTFFKADPRYEYFNDHHGDPASGSYATYGIAEENGSKVLKLRCVNNTTHKFDTMEPVVGEYTVGLDFKLETTVAGSRPGIMVNPFNEYRFDVVNDTGSMTVTVRAGDYARINDSSGDSNVVHWMTNKDGTRFIPKENLWYSMQVRVELGRMALRLWERGDESTALEVVCETAAIGQRAMDSAKYWAIYTCTPDSASAEHTVWVDELRVWRDLTGPQGKQGETGKQGPQGEQGVPGVGIADWRYNSDAWRWEQVYTDGSIKTFPGHSPIDNKFTFFRDDFPMSSYATPTAIRSPYRGRPSWTTNADQPNVAITLNAYDETGGRSIWFQITDSSSRAIVTSDWPISGRATIQFDYKPTPNNNNGNHTDLLDVRVLGNTVRAGVNYNNSCFVYGLAKSDPVRDADGNVFRMSEFIWYRVKLIAEVGRVTMKVWKRDSETEPDGTCGGVTVLEHTDITEELLMAERQLRFEFGPMNCTDDCVGVHQGFLDNVMAWRDLWTEADKAEIVSRVLAALEVSK